MLGQKDKIERCERMDSWTALLSLPLIVLSAYPYHVIEC